ncbi:MAG: flagellar protein export ATPase FliI [Clostridiales bacterium]|nr:flagellar protein export ATPase FliI [Clostridiales bacterium]
MSTIDLNRYNYILKNIDPVQYTGNVTRVIGLTIESKGPLVELGEICQLYTLKGDSYIKAEVVGFKEKNVLLMPYGDMQGIGPGSKVIATKKPFTIPVGLDLLGRVLDGAGLPMDHKGAITPENFVEIANEPPNPLERQRIDKPLSFGIRAIDGMLTCGQGQRMGIFAGSGVGKSTLLGMIARNSDADVNVIALIGERGREVREFLERDLGEDGLKRSVLVVATSDKPALLRVKGAMVATAIAEYFRDMGKNTLFMMDSLTRLAMAQREVGMAIGEPPVARGYTPSVFAMLPKLLERSGNSKDGSITGLFTVLVDGDDFNEPISDAVRGILDGHIVLSRDLANANHYPAIDVLSSVSRVMPDIVDRSHLHNSNRIKELMAVYNESEDLINIGAYRQGAAAEIDEAIDKRAEIIKFLRQDIDENSTFDETISWVNSIVK